MRKKQKTNKLTRFVVLLLFDAKWSWNINIWSVPAEGERLALRSGTLPVHTRGFRGLKLRNDNSQASGMSSEMFALDTHNAQPD